MYWIDPYGLFEWTDYIPDWLVSDGLVNFAAGMGDNLSFGLTDKLRDVLDINDAVRKCSGEYAAGEWAGTELSLATGVVGGIKAAGAKALGKEFSHWIPKRMGGIRSIWNGNYVSVSEHALMDPFRYRFMSRLWKAVNPMPSQAVQMWQRIPKAIKGTAAGAGYGLGSQDTNSGGE